MCRFVEVTLDGLSKYVVNWIMSSGDLVLDKSREVISNIKTVYIIDEVRAIAQEHMSPNSFWHTTKMTGN
jgi:hypothetical protein